MLTIYGIYGLNILGPKRPAAILLTIIDALASEIE